MLDLSYETRGSRGLSLGTVFVGHKASLPPGPGPHRRFPAVPRKSTVKELLMLKRQEGNVVRSIRERPPDRPGPPMSLFQWQILQEQRRVAGMSEEQLGTQDADGDTVLHIAVAQGKRALTYVLAPKMAECGVLDLKERNGQTALQIAAATNNHLIIQDLLSHGAGINTRDLWGRSPLHLCAQKGDFLSLKAIWKTTQRTQQKLDAGMYNYDGLTALHIAIVTHNAVLKELRDLKDPCTFRKKELEQRSQMCTHSVNLLLLMGASVGSKDLKSGRTCLHMASEEANVKLLQIFLEHPSSAAVINAAAFNGNTALHVVSALRNSRCQAVAVKLLMARGADPDVRNLENELPSQLAPEGPLGEKVRRLLRGKHTPK